MSDTYDTRRAYEQGYAAARDGRPKSANPYRGSGKSEEAYWDSGWTDATKGVYEAP